MANRIDTYLAELNASDLGRSYLPANVTLTPADVTDRYRKYKDLLRKRIKKYPQLPMATIMLANIPRAPKPPKPALVGRQSRGALWRELKAYYERYAIPFRSRYVYSNESRQSLRRRLSGLNPNVSFVTTHNAFHGVATVHSYDVPDPVAFSFTAVSELMLTPTVELIKRQMRAENLMEDEVGVQSHPVMCRIYYHVGLRRAQEDPDVPTMFVYLWDNSQKYVTPSADIESIVSGKMNEVFNRFVEYEGSGSGFSLCRINSVNVSFWPHTSFKGSSFIELPTSIKERNAVLNIKNKDNMCFFYCILAQLHPIDRLDHPDRVAKYKPFLSELKVDEFQAPFPIDGREYARFEKVHEHLDISVNVYTIDTDEHIVPCYVTSCEKKNHCDLLYIGGGNSSEVSKLKTEEVKEDFRVKPNGHYTLIRSFSRLCAHETKHTSKQYWCKQCISRYSTLEGLEQHKKNGCLFKTATFMPEKGKNDIMKFKSIHKAEMMPIFCTADFESVLINKTQDKPQASGSSDEVKSTEILNQHDVCGFCIRVCSKIEGIDTRTIQFRGTKPGEAIAMFVRTIRILGMEVADYYARKERMIITDEDRDRIEMELRENKCYLCGKDFKSYEKMMYNHNSERPMTTFEFRECPVRDHCHITGKFLGMAHNSCNLSRQQRYKFMPVIFHNLSGYDGHMIVREFNNNGGFDIELIPESAEKYISFDIVEKYGIKGSVEDYQAKYQNGDKYESMPESMCKVRFIDSFKFMSSKLETLVENLAQDPMNFPNLIDTLIANSNKCDNLTHEQRLKLVSKYMNDEYFMSQVKLLLRKGVYPYEWVDSYEKLSRSHCDWTIDDFYSHVSGDTISKEDYEHYKKVCESFGCILTSEYHDLYLMTDAVLLADVWQNFQKLCMDVYGLDPCWYYTAPGLSFDAALKITDVKLELITDVDMYSFIERGIRGGVSTIFHRYACAKNQYVTREEDMNEMLNNGEQKDNEYLMYLDANNLYGVGMTSMLPIGGFEWEEIGKDEEFDVNNIEWMYEDESIGYIVECDLEYPEALHDSHNDFPLAPELLKVTKEMVSDFTKDYYDTTGSKHTESMMLVPNLLNKNNYITHCENLRLYVSLGLRLTKIHRVLRFNQSRWLSSYIMLNTEMRAKARNNFQKDFHKLMNNSVYGKTMENVRNHSDIQLCNNLEKFLNVLKRPRVDKVNILDTSLVSVEMKKNRVTLNKPIYVGFAVLEASKRHMYNFHYNVMKPKYGENISVLFTDTDSLFYSIKTDDVYDDFSKMQQYFDFSNYPKDHPLYSRKNAAKLGYFKDESGGIPITEFVGLRAKMYSYTVLNDKAKHERAKGVTRAVIKNSITHDDYLDCLFGVKPEEMRQSETMYMIRSKNHQVYTIRQTKTSLSSGDSKRYILDDGINTLAHGHWRIPK